MKNLSAKWQKLIVWLTGYLNIIAFVLAGGYLYFKTEDEDVRSSAKNALVVVAGFTGLDLLRSVIYNLMSLFDASYNSLNVVSKIGVAFTIIKAIVFAVLFVLDLNGIQLKKTATAPEVAAADTAASSEENAENQGE